MTDDLRDRIRRGDLDAFTDDTLPVYLLGELEAAWWATGVARALERITMTMGPLIGLDAIAERYTTARVSASTPVGVCAQGATAGGVATVAIGQVDPNERTRRLLGMVRSWLALASETPPEVTAAMEVIERYLPHALRE